MRLEEYPPTGAPFPRWKHVSRAGDDMRAADGKFGFSYDSSTYATYVYFPAWSAASVSTILPLLWLATWLRRRMVAGAGHCPS